MKKFFVLMLSLTLLAVMFAAVSAEETFVFKHGFDLDYPPYSYINDEGETGGFDVEMAKMQSMAKHLSPDVAKDAMLRTIRASINNGATRYSVKELAMEIIGGSLVAEEVYLEENGCEKLETSEAAAIGEGFSIDSLLGNYVAISNHAFLDTLPSDEEKRIYLESFALVFATIGGYKESHYLTSIAKLFESEDALNRVELLTINPKKISVPDIMKVLSSDDRKYAWCVDAMFIGEEDGNANAKVRNAVLSMCKVFGFKENEPVDVYGPPEWFDGSEEEPAAEEAGEQGEGQD